MARDRSAPRSGRSTDQYQLSFPLSWLSDNEFLLALRMRGVRGIHRVRFRPYRTRLISLSSDAQGVNAHECFRGAPDDVLDAIADFLRLAPGSAAQRRAVAVMRTWCEAQVADEADFVRRAPAALAGSEEQLAFLAALYERLNRERFGALLPADIPIRLSDRMSRRFGHVMYGRSKQRHGIEEIALNIDLMLEGNERHLLDTLVHEMAHVEAWIVHQHRGHGAPWRSIAARVGCEVVACSRVRIRRRRNRPLPWPVPELEAFLRRASARRRPSYR